MSTVKLKSNQNLTKRERLYYMFNNLGFTELNLCYNYLKGDVMRWSRWVRYMDLIHLSEKQSVPGWRYDTKKEFFENASHRSILDIELLFDIDDLILNGSTQFGSIKEKSFWVYHKLINVEKFNTVSFWFTGNKSDHLSVILPELRYMSKQKRRNYKYELLKKYGADVQKAGDRCMIAMENAVHYRSGKPKERVK